MTALPAPPTPHRRTSPPGDEQARRARLGIPADARRVLVLAESSHWDPDWMLTAEQYFRLGVRRTLDLVIDALEAEPRRVWSADCVFFLAMYWQRRPDRRERLAALVESGRFRLMTSGVTTQDTLLPGTESILRDFLEGQEWLRAHGLDIEPRLAAFPDSFGHSPALPSLLRAAGFDRTIVSRIDGGWFVGSDWELPGRFPRPGSGAATLTAAGSADFVWRDAHGSEVLAHWHPFTYGQGDMIASVGPLRYMSMPTAVPDRAESRVAARLERRADRLATLARTPYLLCPIGLDFAHPVVDLLALVDRYNERRYPTSGLWVVNAGADDYLDLVEAHRDDLPVVELDPNPYWTGFYSSRPELKRAHRQLVDELVAAEAEAVADGPVAAARARADLADAWWTAVTGNHHDFITGTSPDRVAHREQEPWLRSARQSVARVRADSTRPAAPVVPAPPALEPVHAEWEGATLTVDTGRLRATVDPARGGSLLDVRVDGVPVTTAPVADLVAHHDTGGLWRMGHEYRGGALREVDRASSHPCTVTVRSEAGGAVVVEVVGPLDSREARREYRFAPGAASLVVRTRCSAADRRTITLTIPGSGPATRLLMDQPGGVVERPAERIFRPTFWPVTSWVAPLEAGPGLSPAVGVEMTRAVCARADGTLEVVVARNATKEKAWRVVPILACPARGHEPGPTSAGVSVAWAPGRRSALARGREAAALLERPDLDRLAAAVDRVLRVEPVEAVGPAEPPEGTSRSAVEVIAMKAASRGPGVVVRLEDRAASGRVAARLQVRGVVRAAAVCDVRERDLEDLAVTVADGWSEVGVARPGTVASVRLVLDASPGGGA